MKTSRVPVGFVLVLTASVLASGCWLTGDILDPPAPQDAGSPPTSDGGGCQWVASSGMGCALISVSCNQLAACPPSWMQANSPGSCPQPGTSVRTETCDGMYRWTLLNSQGFSPGDGYLVADCYYDPSTQLLAGVDSQTPFSCGGQQFGTIPGSCHHDAGVTVNVFACTQGGSGTAIAGGGVD